MDVVLRVKKVSDDTANPDSVCVVDTGCKAGCDVSEDFTRSLFPSQPLIVAVNVIGAIVESEEVVDDELPVYPIFC